MTELRAGVIGMGKMGLLHSAILNSLEGVRLTAVADTEKFITSFFKKNTSNVQVYDDYKKMIEDAGLDIIYITTPVSSHVPMASFCAERKIHFFVEKPLGRDSIECVTLCEAARKSNVISMVGFCLRYLETFSRAKELLDEKVLGDLVNIKATVYQSQAVAKGTGWRFKKEISGGGVLIDLGTHLIDLLLWFFGKIKSVQGNAQYNYSQVEDTVTANIQFESSVEASFAASWNVKNYRLQETTIEIEGTKGKMKINEDYLRISNTQRGAIKEDTFYRQSLYKGVPVDIGGPEYTREDLDFINCIRNDKQPMLNVVDASRTQSVLDSIYKSSKYNSIEVIKYIE